MAQETPLAIQARNVDELVGAIHAGESPKYVFFWSHVSSNGSVGPHVLSQWYEAPFLDDAGRSFQTAEHYMMWRKADLFMDTRLADQILEAPSPGSAKDFGRRVSNFSDDIWLERRFSIVVEGSRLKFANDPALLEYLLATRNRVLVEAAPRDRVWGIGLTHESEFANQPDKWTGLNLLGFALMEARKMLLAQRVRR